VCLQAIHHIKLSTLLVLSFVICTLVSNKAFSQFRDEPFPKPSPSKTASYNEFTFFQNSAYTENEKIPGLEGETKVIVPTHKSAFLAIMLSFALPGLGEYYVGDQIWRGIIFTLIDAGLLYEQIRFINRGNDSTIAFHAFADSLWLPQKYADSLNSKLALAGNPYRVREVKDFTQINNAEDSLETLGFENFTHRLAVQGSQDYYEIISKYIQFTAGWKDFSSPDPTQYSPDYERHAYMRADMNQQFEIASDFLYGMFLNRILSMIDAGLLAKNHNSSIHLEGELKTRQYPDGMMGFIPTAKLRYTF
jgi:hypothetical protein